MGSISILQVSIPSLWKEQLLLVSSVAFQSFFAHKSIHTHRIYASIFIFLKSTNDSIYLSTILYPFFKEKKIQNGFIKEVNLCNASRKIYTFKKIEV